MAIASASSFAEYTRAAGPKNSWRCAGLLGLWRAVTLDPVQDVVVEQGTVLRSLFIVARGVLSVSGGHNGTEMEILRFGPGDHYGEIGLLEAALLNTRPILIVPRPSIRVVSIDEAKTEFEVTAFVEGLEMETSAQNELFDLIYRHAAASGIRLAPSPDRPVLVRAAKGAIVARGSAERTLDIVPIFSALMPEERVAIAGKLKQRSYERG